MKKNIIVDIRSMVESCEFARLLKQFPASEECHYIALTPMAFYVLQENGIAYSRIHDFVFSFFTHSCDFSSVKHCGCVRAYN